MLKQFIFYFFFVSIYVQGISSLQASEDDSRLWQAFIAEGNISDNVRWYAEAQARWKDDVQTFDQGFFRPALNLALSKNSTLWLGYLYADTKTSNGHTYEDRWWQQFQYVSKYNDITWISRSRVEQRNLDNDDKTLHRFRQQVRLSWPINNQIDVSYLVWDEAFWNLNDSNWAGDSGFNQNRLFTGIMWKYTKASRLEIGYLNQYVNGTNGAPNQMNHVISSFVFIGF
jgi:hypothetical protein